MNQVEAFEGSLEICERHASRLHWAKDTLSDHFPLSPTELEELSDLDLAVVDQFIVRFSKLQDAMGAKLLPGVLDFTPVSRCHGLCCTAQNWLL